VEAGAKVNQIFELGTKKMTFFANPRFFMSEMG
jgi:hypothetical protein